MADSPSSEDRPLASVRSEIFTHRKAIVSRIIFTATQFLIYDDRLTIAGLPSFIQKYFSIKETQKGLIQTVVVLVYMVFAPIFNYLGDCCNRKYILVVGVFIRSLFTLCGSLVGPNKFGLFFLLFPELVGIGEFSYVTVAPSIIGNFRSHHESSKEFWVHSIITWQPATTSIFFDIQLC